MFPKNPCRPLAELDATFGIYPIAHGDDKVQIVEAHLAPDLPPSFLLNYRGFLGGSLRHQLAFFVDVPDMQADGVRVFVKEVGHLSLTEPDCLAVQVYFKTGFSIFRIIKNNIHQSTFRPKRLSCRG